MFWIYWWKKVSFVQQKHNSNLKKIYRKLDWKWYNIIKVYTIESFYWRNDSSFLKIQYYHHHYILSGERRISQGGSTLFFIYVDFEVVFCFLKWLPLCTYYKMFWKKLFLFFENFGTKICIIGPMVISPWVNLYK